MGNGNLLIGLVPQYMEVQITKEVEEFIDSLGKASVGNVLRTIDLLEYFGYKLGMPHSKKIKADIYELRIRGEREMRIFYTFHHDQIILFYAFIKKSRRIPQKEIDRAIKKLESLT